MICCAMNHPLRIRFFFFFLNFFSLCGLVTTSGPSTLKESPLERGCRLNVLWKKGNIEIKRGGAWEAFRSCWRKKIKGGRQRLHPAARFFSFLLAWKEMKIYPGAPLGRFYLFFFSLCLATGQTVVSHPSSLFLLRILLLFILVFSLSLFKCSFTPRGNHFERTSKEEEEEKLCYFSSFPFFSSDLLLFPLLTTPIRLGPISLSAPPFTNKKFDFISKINERRIAREI